MTNFVITEAQQTAALARLFPDGPLFAGKYLSGSVLNALITAWAIEFFRLDTTFQQTLDEHDMTSTTIFIDEWESAVGIPDECFDGTGTDEFRRQTIVAKFAQMNLQTEQDFLDLATLFGFTVTITAGGDAGVFPLDFPLSFFPETKTAKHTMLVDLPGEGNTFALPFPIPFGSGPLNLIQCLFNKSKPACVQIIYRFTG